MFSSNWLMFPNFNVCYNFLPILSHIAHWSHGLFLIRVPELFCHVAIFSLLKMLDLLSCVWFVQHQTLQMQTTFVQMDLKDFHL